MGIAFGLIFGLIGIAVIAVAAEILYSISKKPGKDGYVSEGCSGTGYLIYLLYKKSLGENTDDGEIDALINAAVGYINRRNDCSDFRLTMLIRALKDYPNYITPSQYGKIKDALLGFRYWMTYPDSGDSLCMWSENHQLIFSVAEYLAGDMFPEEIFTNDGRTGAEHRLSAEKRIDIWLEHRFNYSYSEWNSSNYFPESLAPMANFIQYGGGAQRVNRMKIVLDLMFFDIALAGFRRRKEGRTYYVFNTTSGRAYADNKISDKIGNLLRPSLDCLLLGEDGRYGQDGWEDKYYDRIMAFRLMLQARDGSGRPFYELPATIRRVFDADYGEGIELKQSNSLYIRELASAGLIGHSDRAIMMQLGMEAFTDYRVINNTLTYLRKNDMLRNSFLSPFRYFNSAVLIKAGVLRLLARTVPLLPNGAALERSNIYIYKTPYYVISTAQQYAPGGFGGQQHIWTMSFSDELSVFTTHPAKRFGTGGSPAYWVGNGRNPHSAQHKNAVLNLYKLPKKRGLGEGGIVHATHAYCPLQFIDEYSTEYLDRGFMFGRSGEAFFMLRSNGALRFREAEESIRGDASMREKVDSERVFTDCYDLLNESAAPYHYWIAEASSAKEDGCFEDFKNRMLASEAALENGVLCYKSGHNLKIEYAKAFYVDGGLVDTEYARYENPYSGAVKRKAGEIKIDCGGASLRLNLSDNIREEE